MGDHLRAGIVVPGHHLLVDWLLGELLGKALMSPALSASASIIMCAVVSARRRVIVGRENLAVDMMISMGRSGLAGRICAGVFRRLLVFLPVHWMQRLAAAFPRSREFSTLCFGGDGNPGRLCPRGRPPA